MQVQRTDALSFTFRFDGIPRRLEFNLDDASLESNRRRYVDRAEGGAGRVSTIAVAGSSIVRIDEFWKFCRLVVPPYLASFRLIVAEDMFPSSRREAIWAAHAHLPNRSLQSFKKAARARIGMPRLAGNSAMRAICYGMHRST